MNKVAFLFGAGADAPYGLPCGGEFAIEIFRSLGKEDKKSLKNELENIIKNSNEAEWFPREFWSKSISIFGKTNYESIIASTLELRRDNIIDTLINFDLIAEEVKKQFLSYNIDIDSKFKKFKLKTGNIHYSQEIILKNKLLESNVEKFFGSDYFSLLIELIKINIFKEKEYDEASTIARSLIEILIGALGKNLTHSLNNSIFVKTPEEIPFFDDIGGVFNIDYKKVGMDALSYIMKKNCFICCVII